MKIQKLIDKREYEKLWMKPIIIEVIKDFIEDLKILQQLSDEEKTKQENNLVWVVNNKSNEEKIKAIMTEIWNKLSDNSYWTVILDLSIHDIEKIIHKHLTKNIEEKENAETFYLGSE